jgi:hypothetical protein
MVPVLILCACSRGNSSEAIRGDIAAPATAEVPTCPAVSLSRTGSRHAAVDATNDRGTWDLRGAVWAENAPDPIDYPVRSDAWTQGCVIGGTIHGNIPRRSTRDQWYDGEDGGTAFGGDAYRQTMTDTAGNFVLIKNAYVDGFEDAYDPNSPAASNTTYLVHVRTGLVRDDCVENEEVPHNLVIRDSLFDGCFTAFAERPSGTHSARNGVGPFSFTLESSLVHIRPQRLGPNYCDHEQVSLGRCKPTGVPDVWLGAYGIWKWSEEAANEVIVRDTIFRLDMPSYSSCSSQEWPSGTYENVTLVWTGHGKYRNAGDCHNRLPKGVRLTTDLAVWREAKHAWLDK